MGSFSIWHWLIVLGIVILVFGTKKLSSLGSDVGAGIRNFKKAMSEGEKEENAKQLNHMEQDATFADSQQKAKSESKSDGV